MAGFMDKMSDYAGYAKKLSDMKDTVEGIQEQQTKFEKIKSTVDDLEKYKSKYDQIKSTVDDLEKYKSKYDEVTSTDYKGKAYGLMGQAGIPQTAFTKLTIGKMSGEGKFFVIRSEMNDKWVVDIDGGQATPGATVQMWEFNGGDNQVFFQDRASKVIRCKQNPDLVIAQNGDHLEVQEFQDGEYNQRFEVLGDKIARADNNNDVFDIAGSDGSDGARICVYDSHGGENQRFRVDHSYPRYCIIKSRMNGKVLDVEGASGDPGAKLIMWEYNGGDNQMWWEDKHGYIHSKMTGYVIDWSNHSDIRCNPQSHGVGDQEFVLSGRKICRSDDPSQCLDIAGEDDSDGAYLCCYDYKGSNNQEWEVEYLN